MATKNKLGGINNILFALLIIFVLATFTLLYQSNKSIISSSNIAPDRMVIPSSFPETVETSTPTLIPTYTPTSIPIIVTPETVSLETEQKLQKAQECQLEMKKYSSCIEYNNAESQRYSDCLEANSAATERYYDNLANGYKYGIKPPDSIYCMKPFINSCYKPTCSY